MAIMLIVLVSLAAVIAWAGVHDLRRRRRQAVDVGSRAAALKAAAQAKASESQIGL